MTARQSFPFFDHVTLAQASHIERLRQRYPDSWLVKCSGSVTPALGITHEQLGQLLSRNPRKSEATA